MSGPSLTTLSRRAALSGLGTPMVGALASACGAGPDAVAAPGSVPPEIFPEQFGAVGDGRVEDWPALTRCLDYAKRRGAAVRLASRSYAVGHTLAIPPGVTVTGAGCGRADEGVGSELLALIPGMLVARMGSQARLASLSIQGAGRARAGLLVQGARPSLADVQVHDVTGHAFMFDNCQNGTFLNICARGAPSCFCLLNGARNNGFFNATAAAGDWHAPGPAPVDPVVWTLMVDITDPWRWGTTTSVTQTGNDANRVFGGIFEVARFGVRPLNPHGHRENGALNGTTVFAGCPEFTVGSLLNSAGQPDWDGTLAFPDGISFIGDDDRTPMTVGEAGRLVFGGTVAMTGAHDMPWRGIACAHNLAERSYARQSLLGPRDVAPRATGIAAPVFPASLLGGAWARRDPITGDLAIDVAGAASDTAGILIGLGGDFAPGQPANARGGLLRLGFAVSGLAPGETVALYVAAPAPTFRRRLAAVGTQLVPGAGLLGNGAYQFAYRLGADETPAVTIARGTARTRFVLSGFEMGLG